jgi:hypothetical protein
LLAGINLLYLARLPGNALLAGINLLYLAILPDTALLADINLLYLARLPGSNLPLPPSGTECEESEQSHLQ